MNSEPKIWSSSDFPYQCLLDIRRTTALQAAINAVVREGDIVVDAGAGSGILSFFAARAGAKQVYAVEVDPSLAECLRRSVVANGFEQVITVVSGDVHGAELPEPADVFICEMMDTGLMDEMQVTAINALRKRGILTVDTRMVPFQYETFLEFGYTDFSYYGYKLLVPKHQWPHYANGNNGWLDTSFDAVSKPLALGTVDFRDIVVPDVHVQLSLQPDRAGLVNAVRVSARTHLVPGMMLGATNALNGDKIVPLGEELHLEPGRRLQVDVRYLMGGGLDSLKILLREA